MMPVKEHQKIPVVERLASGRARRSGSGKKSHHLEIKE
jgi:hypothetical protein